MTPNPQQFYDELFDYANSPPKMHIGSVIIFCLIILTNCISLIMLDRSGRRCADTIIP